MSAVSSQPRRRPAEGGSSNGRADRLADPAPPPTHRPGSRLQLRRTPPEAAHRPDRGRGGEGAAPDLSDGRRGSVAPREISKRAHLVATGPPGGAGDRGLAESGGADRRGRARSRAAERGVRDRDRLRRRAPPDQARKPPDPDLYGSELPADRRHRPPSRPRGPPGNRLRANDI